MADLFLLKKMKFFSPTTKGKTRFARLIGVDNIFKRVYYAFFFYYNA